MTSHHPRDDDRDFAQLAGAFDRPVAPAPSFAAALRRRVESEAKASTTPATTTKPAVVQVTAIRTTAARRRAGARVLEIAAAILLVAALALGALVLNGQRGGDSPDRARLAAVTSPDTTSQSTAYAAKLSGFNGPTWYFPDPAFDARSFEVTETTEPHSSASVESARVDGNYLVQVGLATNGGDSTTPTKSTQQLWVTDLATKQVLWRQPGGFWPNIAISNGYVFAVRTSEQAADPRKSGELSLVALAIDTGAPHFEEFPIPMPGPDVSPRINSKLVSPVVVDDVVYVADPLGTTYAIDARSGTELWKTEGDRGSTPQPSSTSPGATGGSLVADEDALFVVTGANTIQKLDRTTGKVLLVIDVAARLDHDVFGVTLYRDASHLVARVLTIGTPESYSGENEMRPETIASFDPETGSLRWKRDYGDISGDIAVTSDQVIVPARQGPADAIAVDFLNAADGFSHIALDVATAHTMAITATGSHGRTIIMVDTNGDLQIGTLSDDFDFTIDYRNHTRKGLAGMALPTTAVIADGKAITVVNQGTILLIAPQTAATPASATPETAA